MKIEIETRRSQAAPQVPPKEAEIVTARRHELRRTLCLRGWSWAEADAESWRRFNPGSGHGAAIEAVFGPEVA